MNRRILVQVTGPTVVIGLVLFAVCLLSAWYINRLQANLANILKENVASLRAAQQLEISVRQLRFHCFLCLIAPSDDLRKKIAQDDQMFEEWLEKARRSANTSAELELVQAIEKGYDRYHEEFDKLFALVTPEYPRRDFATLEDANPVIHVVEPCRRLLEINEHMMNETAAESERMRGNLNFALLLLGLGGPLSGLLSGYGIARGLSRSIARLSVRVHDMSRHLEQDVASVSLAGDGDLRHLDQQLQHVVRRVEEAATRLQQQQRELARAEQLSAVGKLAACVAHEIRNPLSGVKMLVEVALRDKNPKPLTPEDLSLIHDEVGRLEQTVQNLLDFARPPSLQRVVGDLREVVGQAVDLVRARAGHQQVEIVVRCPDRPVEANIDRQHLATVLVNLFFNALDAMPQGGRIEVELEAAQPDLVRIRITDTGGGITPDMARDLFTPFASNKPTGTGLGLSISRRVVEDHGGSIRAANRRDQGITGACFVIDLPAARRERNRADLAHHR